MVGSDVIMIKVMILCRRGRLAIESYIRGNNLALDISSVLDGAGYTLGSPSQDLAASLA